MARRHAMRPLLFWHLNDTSPKAIPESILAQLRADFYSNSARNLFLTGQLLELLDAFEANGISAIPYKGPTLAAFAYGNLALREFFDLDVLVRKNDVLRAKEVLISEGYRAQYRMTPAQEAAFLRYADQYLYARDDGNAVDLHWEVAPKAFSFRPSTELLWKRLEHLSLGGRIVLVLSPEDMLLSLCVHGATHRWERLGWVCDVAELIHVCKDMDWDRLVEQAATLGSRRVLFLGLFLADGLLGAGLPEELSQRVQADAATRALAEQVYARLFPERAHSYRLFEESLFQPFHLKAMERLRDRARYCFRQATVPSWEDWESLPLPARLFPIYTLVRPIRLTEKYVRRLLAG